MLFTAVPAHPLRLRVLDEHGQPATASFLVRDDAARIYPNISKRLAPDFFFQPQVYRADGETIDLPAGAFTVDVSRGPEYLPQTKRVSISGPQEMLVRLARWIDPSRDGWYSGDHHIHSSGCSHYENPTEGVLPKDMWPQIDGEALNVASVLTWGPSYYYQKQFFSGAGSPAVEAGTAHALRPRDLRLPLEPRRPSRAARAEGSGLPRHEAAGGLADLDAAGAALGEEARDRSSASRTRAGASRCAARIFPTTRCPASTASAPTSSSSTSRIRTRWTSFPPGDTPYVWELNIWYHTLNAGFRTRISGETDFPCITDDRVGLSRSYAKVDGPLTYRKWIDAVQAGRNYVADGKSHLLDFSVNGTQLGTSDSEVRLDRPGRVTVTVRAAAKLEAIPNEAIRQAPYERTPYWDLERARIGNSQEVPVEIVVNGAVAATQKLVADGTIRTLTFDVAIDRSSWIAARILPSSHTNPVFAIVGGKPIRASRPSIEWCLNAVNQCWTQKAPRFRASELEDARKAYDHARQVYRQRLAEAGQQ